MVLWLGAMGRLVCFYVACLLVVTPKRVLEEGLNVPCSLSLGTLKGVLEKGLYVFVSLPSGIFWKEPQRKAKLCVGLWCICLLVFWEGLQEKTCLLCSLYLGTFLKGKPHVPTVVCPLVPREGLVWPVLCMVYPEKGSRGRLVCLSVHLYVVCPLCSEKTSGGCWSAYL